ncbi:MAG TPA: hypothetical protein PLA24_10165 [Tenuifilaceae bacterium]|nr:hypothetical protein [Tenuifilaceae bacterium]
MDTSNKMVIDNQTLNELEIVRDNSAGYSILEMLDQTQTRGGKDALKEIFYNPLCNATLIEQRQQSIKWIYEYDDNFKVPINKKLMDMLEVYFFSKAEVAVAKNAFSRFVESSLYLFKYKNYKNTIVQGVSGTILFIQSIHKFFIQFDKENLPPQIAAYWEQANKIFTTAPFAQTISKSNPVNQSFQQSIAWDQVFRYEYKSETLKLISISYELDALQSLAKSVLKYNLTFPEIINSPHANFEVEGLYHLFLKKPVANNLTFGKKSNFLFLTGPNMAGKTTFLKSCGIAVYLAQIGMAVPATKMQWTPFKALLSSINTSDNLSIGYSFFYAEVMRVKKAAEAVTKFEKCFIIFDELFKGTNIKDAFDGSLLVINGLLNWKSSLFILSSHLTELSKEIDKNPQILFKHFESTTENSKPVFSYRLADGISNERLGLIIIKNEGIDEMLNSNIK